jgi:hypothetical protein
MFCVSEAEATMIREAFEREGELSAGIELRKLFPGITDGAEVATRTEAEAAWPESAACSPPLTTSDHYGSKPSRGAARRPWR